MLERVEIDSVMLTDLYRAHLQRGLAPRNRIPDPCVFVVDVHASVPVGMARLETRAVGRAALDPRHLADRADTR